MHLVLVQPEIPQNMGTLVRFCACMGVPLDVIEPCGFLLTDKHLKRSAMDYSEFAEVEKFFSWSHFCEARPGKRRIAVTASASQTYTNFLFHPSDCLVMGQESVGLPPFILEACEEHVSIPMRPLRRSLNMALAAAIVTTEALRQTHQLPGEQHV